MLFNSFEFIFAFLPITLLVFFWIGKRNQHEVAISWLVLCSLFFYGWWNPTYLALILFSMLFNYAFGVILGSDKKQKTRKGLLILGVVVNLALLGYYKYAYFFVEQVNWAIGSNFHLEKILLPLAISFFTFQQVAYLVDAYRHETKDSISMPKGHGFALTPYKGALVHLLPDFEKLSQHICTLNIQYQSIFVFFYIQCMLFKAKARAFYVI